MAFDLEWSDIMLGHYVVSICICLIVVIATYLISQKHIIQVTMNKIRKLHSRSSENDHKKFDSTFPTSKKSPALAAEEVIKGNMTAEQQLLEHQIRQKQLAQIHELMLKQSDKFGQISLSDLEEQMKLYQ